MALHRIGQARETLHSILVGLLDEGRVSAYPADQNVGVQVWIDVPTVQPSGNGIVADFPLHCTYDGSDSAQVAGLDDLVSRIWDACERTSGIEPQRSQPGPDLSIGQSVRRRQIVTVRAFIAARTLCLPDAPGASPIPPDKTQE